MRLVAICIGIIMIIGGCAPIGKMTKVKKVPVENAMHYCSCIPSTTLAKSQNSEWVVFSDRNNNNTSREPGGNNKLHDLKFMQPLWVIGQKGDFLEVVNYQAGETENRLFKDAAKAKWYGYIHKTRVLTNLRAFTNLKNGLPHKYIINVADMQPLIQPNLFFANDSVVLYADPLLKEPIKKANLNQLVYLMKWSDDRSRALVAAQPEITPENATSQVLGWIAGNVLQHYGQRLFIKIPDSLAAKTPLSNLPIYKYSPISQITKTKPSVDITTGAGYPAYDRRFNFVTNVKGEKIYFSQMEQLCNQLNMVNVFFIIEAGSKTISQYNSLAYAISQMQPLFDNTPHIKYNFVAITAMRKNNQLVIDGTEPTPHFESMAKQLIARSAQINQYNPIIDIDAWKGLEKANALASKMPKATNLMIHIGEMGNVNDWSDRNVAMRLGINNSRLLGLQVYSGYSNAYNNYVLQLTNIIKGYAPIVGETKKEYALFAAQIKTENVFIEKSKNFYSLDFPDRSMAQGGILFAEKEQFLAPEIMANNVKLFVNEVVDDHKQIKNGLEKGFATIGNQSDRYDSLMLVSYNKPRNFEFVHDVKKQLPTQQPVWWKPIKLNLSHNEFAKTEQYLLLTEAELARITAYFEQLSAFKLNRFNPTAQPATKVAKGASLSQNDVNPVRKSLQAVADTTTATLMYETTTAVRKAFFDFLIAEIRVNRECEKMNVNLGTLTVAQAIAEITGINNQNELFRNTALNVIHSRSSLSNKSLDDIFIYFKQQKLAFDAALAKETPFEVAGTKYYWINTTLMP